MITKFVTVYPGHIDLPDLGQNATPANERRYSNEQLASIFEKTEAIAKEMDALGFDTLWLAEHHFQHEGYECIPNILMLAVHLAHVTKRLRIGCGFNIAPMWHPLRLAEDFAVADILTKGRTVFGVGRGYHTREVETFGAPMQDADANRELSRSRSRSSSRPSTRRPSPTRANTTRCRRPFPTGVTISKTSPSFRDPSTDRSSAGSRSSAPTRAGSTSWYGTASRALSAAVRRQWRRDRSRAIATQPPGLTRSSSWERT
jgi:hypothetical protein